MESNIHSIMADIINGTATVYMFLILIRSLMTWLRQEVITKFYGFFDAVAKVTDPVLNLIRKIFPSYMGRVDLSPFIALLLVEIIKHLLIYGLNLIYNL